MDGFVHSFRRLRRPEERCAPAGPAPARSGAATPGSQVRPARPASSRSQTPSSATPKSSAPTLAENRIYLSIRTLGKLLFARTTESFAEGADFRWDCIVWLRREGWRRFCRVLGWLSYLGTAEGFEPRPLDAHQRVHKRRLRQVTARHRRIILSEPAPENQIHLLLQSSRTICCGKSEAGLSLRHEQSRASECQNRWLL